MDILPPLKWGCTEMSNSDAKRQSEPVHAAETPLFRLSESPAHLLRRAQQFASDIFATAGLADGVTLRQTFLLAAIAEEEGRSQSALVRATGIDRSTLADMIQRMERKGLITRAAASSDGRAKSVSLTEAGRDALAEAAPAMVQVDTALLDALPRNKRRSFLEMLGHLAEAANDEGVVEQPSREKKADKTKPKKKKKKKAKKK